MNSVEPGLYWNMCEAYRSCGFSDLTKKQWKIVMGLMEKSMMSAIKIQDYEGQYEVPEVWLAQDVSADKIKKMSSQSQPKESPI